MAKHDEELLRLYSIGKLTSRQQKTIEAHLEACPACQNILAEWHLLADVAARIAEVEPTTLPPLQLPNVDKDSPMTTRKWASPASLTTYRFPLTAAVVCITTLFLVTLMLMKGSTNRELNSTSLPGTPEVLTQSATTIAGEGEMCRYTIAEGDTILSALAACDLGPTSVNLYRVQAVNGLDDNLSVYPGQEITVPVNQAPGQIPNPNPRFALDSVKPVYCTSYTGVGATLASLLERCGLPETEENLALVRASNHLPGDSLPIGRAIMVPLNGEVIAPEEQLIPVWVAAQLILGGTEITVEMVMQAYYPATLGIDGNIQDFRISPIARKDIPAFMPLTTANTRLP